MVKIGFIVEGASEQLLINSEKFNILLSNFNLEKVACIDAEGSGNLLPKNIDKYINICKQKNSEKIIVIVDLEEEKSKTNLIKKINPNNDFILIIEVKAIESWLLADNKLLSTIFKEYYNYEFPEDIEPDYYENVKQIFLTKTKRGIGNFKPKFYKSMIRSGFDILESAKHPNCNSAKYFIDTLKKL